jgi:hypothetical protein
MPPSTRGISLEPTARLADAGDLGDGTGLAAAAQDDAQDGLASLGLGVGHLFDFGQVAFVLQNVRDVAAHARPGNPHFALGGARGVADGGQEIGERIGLHGSGWVTSWPW